MSGKYKSIDTKLIHAGELHPRVEGALVLPIFQSATFEYEETTDYHSIRYMRLNNTPNHIVLHKKLAALENAEAAIVTASGMAAISTALLTFLSSGDHLLCQSCLYGGTNDLVTKDFPEYDIKCDFVDASNPDSWKNFLKANTKVFYVETMTNPTMDVADLKAVVRFARENGIITMIDNTFASPVNFRPVEHGFDISLHSATKFLNGHSDLIGGAIIGRRDLVDKMLRRLNHLGGAMDTHACFLLHRGLKTLALRMRYQNESALKLAEFLENHPAVQYVKYPGLASHPDHLRAKELLDGFGGMLSFDPGGDQNTARRILKKLKLVTDAPSLGGVETIISIPAMVSHSGLSPEERRRSGITDSLIRVSVGIEATEDLIEDFVQALKG